MAKSTQTKRKLDSVDIQETLKSLPKDLDDKSRTIIAEACAEYLVKHISELPKQSLKQLRKKIKR